MIGPGGGFMIKAYLIRKEFGEILKSKTALFSWMEGKTGYERQLEQMLLKPQEVFQKLADRLSDREDLWVRQGRMFYHNELTGRNSTLEVEQFHLLLSDRAEYPFLDELRRMEGLLVLAE